MIRFVFRRMWNRKWMIAGLLIGNLLMIAIAAAAPMYSEAIMQRVLTRNLSDYLAENNRYPGNLSLESAYRKTYLDKKGGPNLTEFPLEELLLENEVEVLYEITAYYRESLQAKPLPAAQDQEGLMIKLTAYSGVQDHIQVVNGALFSGEISDNTFDVIVNEKTFMTNGLMLGQEFELSALKDENGTPYRARVSGIFQNPDQEDLYWTSDPEAWSKVFVMDEGLAKELFCGKENDKQGFSATWTAVLDYTALTPDTAAVLLESTQSARERFKEMGSRGLNANYEKVLKEFAPLSQKLNTTLWVLQVPVFILLAAFIFMVSGQLLEMEQNEISVYKSRGAGKGQIIRIYFLQSLVIALIGILAGIPLGGLICRVLGASNSFLSFVSRAALPVKVTPLALGLAVGAALTGVCTMVLPVFKFADVDIVSHKRKKSRTKKRPWWQMVFLDLILIAVSLYGLYQFEQQREYLAQKVLDGAALDPLLYFCSSLFMLGAALFALRLFPLLVRLVYKIGEKWWSPAAYASFLRLLRAGGNQGFILVFLILTVAMGIFNAQAARTINTNAEEKIRYAVGADLVVQEVWDDNQNPMEASGMAEPSAQAGQSAELVYQEPDFGKYQEMEEIESVTRVLVEDDISLSVDGGKLTDVTLMGIHTKEFGQTAWFKDSLLSAHWYEYLNAMSQNARAILVSSNFREDYGYEVGDVISYRNDSGDAIKGVIYGFVDYWPSYAPVSRTKGSDGLYRETKNYLIVAHLSQIQSAWGITPYQVWIKTKHGSSAFLYEYAEEKQMEFALFEDCAAQLVALKNEPVFQGTNGILTVGFICVLLLCSVGFLIYWILSIHSRTLQFGIFRAMGMSMGEVVSMLTIEQIFLTGGALGAGALVGSLSSDLFVPLIQIAYSASDQVIPLEIVSQSGDYVRLFSVVGCVILVCMVILGILISKIKISQALKLGED